MATPTPTPARSHTRRNIVIVIIILIVVDVGGFVYFSQGPARFTGSVSTQAFDTHPTSIVFKSASGPFYAANISNGTYTISLPNHGTFTVIIFWSGAQGSRGQCIAGSLVVNDFSIFGSAAVQNWSC